MSLKLHLKPHEKIIIGGAVVRSGSRPVEFVVENRVPILRQKDIMTESGAHSPARRVYFLLQLIYIDSGSSSYVNPDCLVAYRELEQEIVTFVPSAKKFFDEINSNISAGKLYQALKAAQGLVEYEQMLLTHVDGSTPEQIDTF